MTGIFALVTAVFTTIGFGAGFTMMLPLFMAMAARTLPQAIIYAFAGASVMPMFFLATGVWHQADPDMYAAAIIFGFVAAIVVWSTKRLIVFIKNNRASWQATISRNSTTSPQSR